MIGDVNLWMLLIGGSVVVLAVYDALATTLTSSTAAGPVTAGIGRGLWWAVRRITSGPRSPVMTWAGPVIVVVTVVAWMSMLWAGWSLVFSADTSAVVATSTDVPADLWDRVYYTAYTLFTLGNGEFKPNGAGWQIATGVAVANGLGLATLAITYLIPVMTAVTERRQQAATISGIGRSAQDFIVHSWNGEDLHFLDQPLLHFAEEINRTAQRHLTYPILHFFHSRDRSDEFAVSIGALDEALTIITLAVDEAVRPHPAAVRAARRAIGRLLDIIQASFSDVADQPPPPPDLQALRDAGVPVVDDERFRQLLSRYDERRQALYGFTTGSTWPWYEAVEQ